MTDAERREAIIRWGQILRAAGALQAPTTTEGGDDESIPEGT